MESALKTLIADQLPFGGYHASNVGIRVMSITPEPAEPYRRRLLASKNILLLEVFLGAPPGITAAAIKAAMESPVFVEELSQTIPSTWFESGVCIPCHRQKEVSCHQHVASFNFEEKILLDGCQVACCNKPISYIRHQVNYVRMRMAKP